MNAGIEVYDIVLVAIRLYEKSALLQDSNERGDIAELAELIAIEKYGPDSPSPRAKLSRDWIREKVRETVDDFSCPATDLHGHAPESVIQKGKIGSGRVHFP